MMLVIIWFRRAKSNRIITQQKASNQLNAASVIAEQFIWQLIKDGHAGNVFFLVIIDLQYWMCAYWRIYTVKVSSYIFYFTTCNSLIHFKREKDFAGGNYPFFRTLYPSLQKIILLSRAQFIFAKISRAINSQILILQEIYFSKLCSLKYIRLNMKISCPNPKFYIGNHIQCRIYDTRKFVPMKYSVLSHPRNLPRK